MIQNNYLKASILSLVSTLLLCLGWNTSASILTFLAFIPLFIILGLQVKFKLVFVYFSLVLWNTITTLWIYNINEEAGVAIYLINSAFLVLPFATSRLSKNTYVSQAIFICSWLTIDYMQHHWAFCFPYLSLGNGLAAVPHLIQWYEYTGVLGGTLWVLAVNSILFVVYKTRSYKLGSIVVLSLIVIPIFISMLLKKEVNIDNRSSLEVVAVHTNLDCYTYKNNVSKRTLINEYLNLSKQVLTKQTAYVLWPETAIIGTHWIFDDLEKASILNYISEELCEISPKVNVLSGIYFNKAIDKNNKIDFYSYYSKKRKQWYYRYNGAISIVPNASNYEYRSKQILVPLEEYTPYPEYTAYLKKYVKSFSIFNFYKEKENGKVFHNPFLNINVGYAICYETLFGEEITKYTNNNAQILFIGLNEGWSKNKTASRHFNNFGILRAIENRKFVVRASNDGVSSIIDINGKIIQEVSEYKPKAIRASIYPNLVKTYYVKHGDYIGKMAAFLLFPLISIALLLSYKNRKNDK